MIKGAEFFRFDADNAQFLVDYRNISDDNVVRSVRFREPLVDGRAARRVQLTNEIKLSQAVSAKERGGLRKEAGDGVATHHIETRDAHLFVQETTDALTPYSLLEWEAVCDNYRTQLRSIQSNNPQLDQINWEQPDIAFQQISADFDYSEEFRQFCRTSVPRVQVSLLDMTRNKIHSNLASLFHHAQADIELGVEDVMRYYLHQRNAHRARILEPLILKSQEMNDQERVALKWNLNAIFSLNVILIPKTLSVLGSRTFALSSCTSLADINTARCLIYPDRQGYLLDLIESMTSVDSNLAIDNVVGKLKRAIIDLTEELSNELEAQNPQLTRSDIFSKVSRIVSHKLEPIVLQLLRSKPMNIYGTFTEPVNTLDQYALCQTLTVSQDVATSNRSKLSVVQFSDGILYPDRDLERIAPVDIKAALNQSLLTNTWDDVVSKYLPQNGADDGAINLLEISLNSNL